MILYEKSCGAVVFTIEDNLIKYVIIESLEGIFGFPKGHMEDNETKLDTAKREIFEEVGINVDFIKGFRTIDEHPLPNRPNVIKQVVYFLANYNNQKIKYQESELLSAKLMTYDEAIDNFQFDSSKRILYEANEFILKNVLRR